MSNDSYLNKINLLKLLKADIYIKKNKHLFEKNFYHKQVIINDILKKKHYKLIDNFLSAAKEFYPNLIVNFLSTDDILLRIENLKELDKNYISLIFCDKDTLNNLPTHLICHDNIYKSNLNKNIFLFNTSLVSDNISNDVKKLIWNDFKYITKI